ncbi:unnamed protein product [Blumeria hordei]|uniref:Csep0049 effector protein n=1 Tax=Blumeria hordei TaxID=2867405 RepID=A0A383UMK2_BLUHO|nr:unnamed protein product [Blumeria hordei]
MLYLSFIVATLASAVTAQLNLPNNPNGVAGSATAPPSPRDISLPFISDASSRFASISREIAGQVSSVTSSIAAQASSLKSEASGNIMSVTSSLGAEASSISSKASSISSEIVSKTSALNGSKPTGTATDNAASHPTGAMAFGALFGAGVIVANL